MSKKINYQMHTSLFLGAVLGSAILTSSCSPENRDEAATQVIARVDNDEISVHQLNFLLSHTQAASEADAKDLRAQAVKKLVDESLMVNQAKKLKLDRNPDVLLAMENAKRQVLAQAWMELTVKDTGSPSEQELKAFYVSHPELFKEHKIYRLKELVIDQTPENQELISRLVKANENIDALVESLEKQKIDFKQNLSIQPAEQLPMEHLSAISKLNNGSFISFLQGKKLLVLGVLSVKEDPIEDDKAQPFIKSFLINSTKKARLEQALDQLRKNAQIKYLGVFSENKQPDKNIAAVQEGEDSKTEPEDFIAKGVTGLK